MISHSSFFFGKKVIITGGLGFIGSNLAKHLIKEGAKVTIIDSLIPEYGGNLFNIRDIVDKVTVNISDVRDTYSIRTLIKDQDYLFNLAGQTSHMDSMQDPETDLQINCLAQLSILEACKKINPSIQIVYASTRQIYGHPDYLPVDEKHILKPVDVNGINKMAGEWYHILYNNVYGIRSCSLRLTNTYGPNMRIRDARQTFLGVWILNLLQGKPIEVWGGDQLRDFNYIDDVVDAFLLSASNQNSYGKVFNLGSNEIINLTELAEQLIRINSSGEYIKKPFPSDRKRIDIGNYYADYKLISSALGWTPKICLEEGLSQTLQYYRKHLEEYIK